MNRYKSLVVRMDGKKVGVLAVGADRKVSFQYDREWLLEGYSISPFSLPLRNEVFTPRKFDPFEGLFGVFADSLPDGWGRSKRRQEDSHGVCQCFVGDISPNS